MKLSALVAASMLVTVAAQPALAHAKIEGNAARIGQPYVVNLDVPHGCEGEPTIEVLVQIPPGFLNAEPVAADGWQAATTTGAYAEPRMLDGNLVTEGVTEVSWSGGSLPDDAVATFAIKGVFASDLQPGRILFPMVQLCPSGEEAWISEDAEGDNPAPSVVLER